MKLKFKIQGEYKPFQKQDLDFEIINTIVVDNKEHRFKGNIFKIELEHKSSTNTFTSTHLLNTAARLLDGIPGVYPKSIKLVDGFEVVDLEKYEVENEYLFMFQYWVNSTIKY